MGQERRKRAKVRGGPKEAEFGVCAIEVVGSLQGLEVCEVVLAGIGGG